MHGRSVCGLLHMYRAKPQWALLEGAQGGRWLFMIGLQASGLGHKRYAVAALVGA